MLCAIDREHAVAEALITAAHWQCVIDHYFAPGEGAKYCDQRVCVSARMHQNRMSKLHEMFLTCYFWPSLDPFLTAVQYVIHFLG